MPTYEYRCKYCGHQFDVVQAFTDDPLTECPSCDGPLKKVFGNVGIAFKGSGFYKTDSRSGSSSSGSSSSSGRESGGSSDSSSDSSSGSSSSSSSGSSSGSSSSSSSDSKASTPSTAASSS